MSKPSLLLDFDHTLFDTQRLKEKGSYEQIVDYVLHTDEPLDSYLYPDTLDFLETMSQHFELVLFTEAQVDFQELKIKKSHLEKYFLSDKIHIYPPDTKIDALSDLVTHYRPKAIVDDRPEVINEAALLGLTTIRIRRGKYYDQANQTKPTYEVESLSEIITKGLLMKQDIFSSQRIHLVGIKGVGMTPIALMLDDLGKDVSGSDTGQSQITDEILSERDISLTSFEHETIKNDIDLIIYSGAYKVDQNPHLLAARKLGIPLITQAQALAELMNGKDLIAFCGVGGKTTSSAMLATIMCKMSLDPSWFVGVSLINGNLAPGHLGSGPFFIAEADEYAIAPGTDTRPKFALYQPKVIVCTNLIFDHPDIYTDYAHTQQTFVEFFNKLPDDGLLVISQNTQDLDQILNQLTTKAKVFTFGDDQLADWQLITTDDGFKARHEMNAWDFNLSVVGKMNGLNALGCLAAVHHLGLDVAAAAQALEVFTGTKRRMELIGEVDGIKYFDDYAHHPHEIQSALSALKEAYPDRRLICVFHPHTFSRTKALFQEFAHSFGSADQVILAPIFASAREKKDESVSSGELAKAIGENHPLVTALDSFESIIEHLKNNRQNGDIILTVGAGDIYKIHQKLIPTKDS